MLEPHPITDRSWASKPAAWIQTTGWRYPLLLFVITLATFWQCLTLPFIQDDWVFLRQSLAFDTAHLIEKFLDFRVALTYRPAGRTYLMLLFKTFGETAWPCHVLALCIHMLTAFIIMRIMKMLTKDPAIAVLCSLIYASAVAVLLEPLCWAVGIFDLGGAFFFFTSIALFLSGRPVLSALSFFAGILFKESVILLPLILAAIGLARLETWSMKNIQSLARQILPHCIVLLLALGVNMTAGVSPFKLSADNPYVFVPFGSHVLENAYRYACWLLQGFLPSVTVQSCISRFPITSLIVSSVFIAALSKFRWTKLIGGLALWIVLSLLTVLFMPNHCYRYYAIYALPAFICAVLLLFSNLLTCLGIRLHRDAVLACAGALCIFLSVVQSNRILAEGLNTSWILSDGTNHLIRRAAHVNIVKSQLLLLLPRPSTGAAILLGGVDLGAFDKNAGPHVWYRDTTLTTADLRDLRLDDKGFFIENQTSLSIDVSRFDMIPRINLDAANLHAFYLSGQTLMPIATEDLIKLAEKQSAPAGNPR
jgi:hypothetical protein